MKGRLKRWNDDKGYGFITLKENNSQDIFIHISALKKMNRRPIIGDQISFEIHIDNKGKKRATNAQIIGVKEKVRVNKTTSKANSYKLLLLPALLITFFAYASFSDNSTISDSPYLSDNHQSMASKNFVQTKPKPIVRNHSYVCERDKSYCSQMRSCAEAKFYLKNCPNTKMDGDFDGIPCEKQWCH